jgi:hypothetical protein
LALTIIYVPDAPYEYLNECLSSTQVDQIGRVGKSLKTMCIKHLNIAKSTDKN